MAPVATKTRPTETSPEPTQVIDLAAEERSVRSTEGRHLPEDWEHASLVEHLAEQPRRRRESIYTAIFAVVAAVWAPIGVVAVLAGLQWVFLGVTALALLLVVAPRPTALADRVRESDRIQGAIARVRPAAQELYTELRPVPREFAQALGDMWDELVEVTGPALASTTARFGRARDGLRARLETAGPGPHGR